MLGLAGVAEAVPIVEEAAPPAVEEADPVVEEAAPVVEEAAPVVAEAAPVVEEPAPVVEEAPVAAVAKVKEEAPAVVALSTALEGTCRSGSTTVALLPSDTAGDAGRRCLPSCSPAWVLASGDAPLGVPTRSEEAVGVVASCRSLLLLIII